jgi:hypothetical protein
LRCSALRAGPQRRNGSEAVSLASLAALARLPPAVSNLVSGFALLILPIGLAVLIASARAVSALRPGTPASAPTRS